MEGFLFYLISEIYGDLIFENIFILEIYRGNVFSIGLRVCYDEFKCYGEILCVNFV